MAIQLPKILKNFNLFVDGRGKAGRCDSVKLPDLNIRTEEHRGGGMDTPIAMDMGTELLTLDFVMAEYDPDTMALWGIKDQAGAQLTFRGAADDDAGTTQAVVAQARGKIITVSPADVSAGQKNTVSHSVNLAYYRLSIGGVTVTEIDAANGRRIVGGVDVLAAQRAALQI